MSWVRPASSAVVRALTRWAVPSRTPCAGGTALRRCQGERRHCFSLPTPFPLRIDYRRCSSTHSKQANNKMSNERTYIMIKPDGVQRGLISAIIQRFERRGYFLVAMKLVKPTKAHAERHYQDLASKPFYGGLTDFLSSGPVVAMVWQGKDVVKTGRKIIGATNPLASEPGSIRGDYCIDVGRNIIHGSDSVESAQKEIALWFSDDEIIDHQPTVLRHIYE